MSKCNESPPVLYIFSGLPGVGKTTLARVLAKRACAMYLRIDTVEQALRDLCAFDVHGEGYRLSYRIASDNLRLGFDVIADSCNPVELTRDEWEAVAMACGARFLNIQVICSNPVEHKRRVEERSADISRLRLPAWEQIESREYHVWSKPRVVIDTADRSVEESVDELLHKVANVMLFRFFVVS